VRAVFACVACCSVQGAERSCKRQSNATVVRSPLLFRRVVRASFRNVTVFGVPIRPVICSSPTVPLCPCLSVRTAERGRGGRTRQRWESAVRSVRRVFPANCSPSDLSKSNGVQTAGLRDDWTWKRTRKEMAEREGEWDAAMHGGGGNRKCNLHRGQRTVTQR